MMDEDEDDDNDDDADADAGLFCMPHVLASTSTSVFDHK